MTEAPASAGDSYENTAEDHAHVEAQIGVVHGDVNFYKMAGGESPAEKYRVGRNYLAGNMPRQAEKLIGEAFMAGHRSTEMAYYWALAVLSNRSFDHLGDDEFDQLTEAFSEIERHPTDGWMHALGVVAGLVQSLVVQEEQLEVDPAQFDAALGQFADLPAERRDEVRRHMEMMLAGELQDRLEAQHAAEMAARRMADERLRRVWKFFQPHPEPPRLLRSPEVESRQRDIAVVAGGAGLLLLCLYLGGALLLGMSAVLFAVSLVLYLGGAYAIVRYGLQRWALAARASWVEARFRGISVEHSAGDWAFAGSGSTRARFAAQVRERVDHRFRADRRPTNGREVSTWMDESSGIRATLVREIIEQYSWRDSLPRIDAIDWLIRWHADTLFAKWEQGKLRDDRAQAEVPREMAVASVLGPAALGLSVLLTAVNLVGYAPFTGLLMAVGWGLGTVAVWGGAVALHRKSALASWLADEAERRKLQENKAYADWYKSLEDRPTDAQIAAWLDYDKAHIKALAMKHCGLANRDLIAHVVLTGAASTARYAARVLYGPLRYSTYTVQVFLLTEGGVREVTVDLHLPTGVITNERRRAFGYHAISSAVVSENGIRVDGMTVDAKQGEAAEPGDTNRGSVDKLVFSQEFELTLNNLQAVHLVIGNFDEGLIDRVIEDPRHLFELSRDTSGATPALRILEAIAAEGRDWVRQERLRRHRRIRDYQRKRGERLALEAGGTVDASDVPAPRLERPVRRELK